MAPRLNKAAELRTTAGIERKQSKVKSTQEEVIRQNAPAGAVAGGAVPGARCVSLHCTQQDVILDIHLRWHYSRPRGSNKQPKRRAYQWADSGTGLELEPEAVPRHDRGRCAIVNGGEVLSATLVYPPCQIALTLRVAGGLHKMLLRDGALHPVSAVKAA